MARSVLAVIAGFILINSFTGAIGLALTRLLHPVPPFLTLLYSALIAVFSGYGAAVLARRLPLLHALALALVVFLASLYSVAILQGGNAPNTGLMVLLVLVRPIMVVAGGWLRALQAQAGQRA